MDELMKVREVSLKYDISTRALKYYEDMGLISSIRQEGYAYRLYDETAVKRLEQILILRKLNIKIKDIQKIFSSDSSETVLEVLGQKVTDIDDEVALLHDLRDIVLDFIRQIESSDFHSQEDINRLYSKANELEAALLGSDYEGASSRSEKLSDVAKRTRRLLSVRTVTLPKRRILLYEEYDTLPDEVKNIGDVFYPTRFTRFNRHVCDVQNFVVLPEGFPDVPDAPADAFEGGLYALGILQGDTQWGIETDASLLYKWTAENGFALRENDHMFWNMLPSVGTQPPLLEMYIPIALLREQKPSQALPGAKEDFERLYGSLRVRETHSVDLKTLICEEPASCAFLHAELNLQNDGNDEGGLRTKDQYTFPLMIRLRAKTDSTNIRLAFAKGALVFNWGVAVDSLIGRDLSDGSFFHHEPGGYIPINQYADIVWILERDYMAVAVDGEFRLRQSDMPYMKAGAAFRDHVVVNAAFRSALTVSKLEVTELL